MKTRFFLIAALLTFSIPAQAKITCDHQGCRPEMGSDALFHSRSYHRSSHRQQRYHASSAREESHDSGIVRSHKTNAIARVGSRYVGMFQAYIDDLEANGAIVKFMGGIRSGHCWSGEMHPCGKALDVCQYSRGVVDHRCHLPGRSTIAEIAARHGLFEGGQWCNSDYGHAQVGISAAACETRLTHRYHHKKHARM